MLTAKYNESHCSFGPASFPHFSSATLKKMTLIMFFWPLLSPTQLLLRRRPSKMDADACANPLSDSTVLVEIAEAARKDPATLQPALVALQAKAPDLLLRVQNNQAAFLALLQHPPSATADAVLHSAIVTQPTPEVEHRAGVAYLLCPMLV